MTFLSGLLAKKRWQWVSPTLSKPDTGKGRVQTVQFIGTRASGHPSWPGVADSTQGRIHWRRPSAILRFSLASLRRTIHTGKHVYQALDIRETSHSLRRALTCNFAQQMIHSARSRCARTYLRTNFKYLRRNHEEISGATRFGCCFDDCGPGVCTESQL